MKLSIVTTLYYSEPYILEFYQRIVNSAKKITEDYEIILVNDGSPDNSLSIAKTIQSRDKKINIIDLSRNFGHHKAIMTGLSYAKGEFIFLIDCDLEEDPDLLLTFWDAMKKSQGVDVIYGVQGNQRKGKFFEKFFGHFFYKTINLISDIKITKNLMIVRLMTHTYVRNLLRHMERELVFVGIAALTGFKQQPFSVIKISKGTSTYTFRKKINLAINFITSLTNKPLVYIFYLGVLLTIFSLTCSSYMLFRKIFYDVTIGWSSVMLSIWFFSGVIIFCLGIIGIYLSKIFIEVKQRPYTIVKKFYSSIPNE